jgi:hypothetical protein
MALVVDFMTFENKKFVSSVLQTTLSRICDAFVTIASENPVKQKLP